MTLAFVAATSKFDASFAATVDSMPTHATGDLLLLFVGVDGALGPLPTSGWGDPSGWTRREAGTYAAGWSRVATSAAEGVPSVSIGGLGAYSAIVAVYRDASLVDGGTDDRTASSQTISAPATIGGLIVGFGWAETEFWTAATGQTVRASTSYGVVGDKAVAANPESVSYTFAGSSILSGVALTLEKFAATPTAAAGQATVTGVARATSVATPTAAAGQATVGAQGGATFPVTPVAAAGQATVAGVGIANTQVSPIPAAGQATVAGVTRVRWAGVPTAAAGQATVAGVGRATTTSPGTAAGLATVSGTSSTVLGATGTAAGLATVAGTLRAVGTMHGTAAGLATVSGVGARHFAGLPQIDYDITAAPIRLSLAAAPLDETITPAPIAARYQGGN